jgi:hypothetical protein
MTSRQTSESKARETLTIIPPQILYDSHSRPHAHCDNTANDDHADDVTCGNHVSSGHRVLKVGDHSCWRHAGRDFVQRIALGDQRHDHVDLFLGCGHLGGGSYVEVGEGRCSRSGDAMDI